MNTTAQVSLGERGRFDEQTARALMQPERRSARLLPPGEATRTLTGSPPSGSRTGTEEPTWDWLTWRLQHPVTLPSPLNDVF
jgi:hypothetical protein